MSKANFELRTLSFIDSLQPQIAQCKYHCTANKTTFLICNTK